MATTDTLIGGLQTEQTRLQAQLDYWQGVVKSPTAQILQQWKNQSPTLLQDAATHLDNTLSAIQSLRQQQSEITSSVEGLRKEQGQLLSGITALQTRLQTIYDTLTQIQTLVGQVS